MHPIDDPPAHATRPAARVPPDAWLLIPIALCVARLGIGADVYDAGELAAAAALLGASHPPGQPLHALLGHAVAFVPLGSIPFRLAALSLACEGLAAFLVLRITRRALGDAGRWSALAPHAAAACVLLSPPLLRQAVRVEVYGPALVIALFGVYEALGALERRPGALPRACFAAGLVATLHPPHVVAPLAMVAVVALADRRDLLRTRGFFLCSLLLGAGTLTSLYLPLRARAGAPMWGDPQTLSGLWEYVSASAYGQNLSTSTGLSWALVTRWFGYAAGAVGYLPILGVALALASPSLRRGFDIPRPVRLLAIAAPIALVGALIQPLEERNPDNVAYAAPAVALLCAAGAAALARALEQSRRAFGALTLAVVALNPLALGAAAEHTSVAPPALESLAAVITSSPPTRALLVAESDFVASSFMMAQAIDGARPDVALFITGLGTSSWHWRSLAPHPAFDGRPFRGPGASPRVAYPRGAVALARGRVPVAVEPSWLEPQSSSPVGPFAVHPAAAEPPSTRFAFAHAASEAAALPLGDRDAAGAVVRNAVVARSARAAALGRTDDALRWLDRLLFWLPHEERGHIRADHDEGNAPRRRPAGWIRDERAFLVGREDVVRGAAVLVAAERGPRDALALLEGQVGRGDPRGALQIGAILLEEGDRAGAEAAFARAIEIDPDLAATARALHASSEAPR